MSGWGLELWQPSLINPHPLTSWSLWYCADYGCFRCLGEGPVFCRWQGISVCVSCHINKPFVLVVFLSVWETSCSIVVLLGPIHLYLILVELIHLYYSPHLIPLWFCTMTQSPTWRGGKNFTFCFSLSLILAPLSASAASLCIARQFQNSFIKCSLDLGRKSRSVLPIRNLTCLCPCPWCSCITQRLLCALCLISWSAWHCPWKSFSPYILQIQPGNWPSRWLCLIPVSFHECLHVV